MKTSAARTSSGHLLQMTIFLAAELLLLLAGCTTPRVESQQSETLSVHKEQTLSNLAHFDFERRRYYFLTLDRLAHALWTSRDHSVLFKGRTTRSDPFFEKFPIIVLSDRDSDGKADQFQYLEEGKSESQEVGFIFDLNQDGRIDYIVFNGGPLMTKDKKLAWQNYHSIDSNYDGRVDIFVYNNNIDLNNDKFFDEDISAWIYDRNADGLVDSAEYLGKDFARRIDEENGMFTVKTVFGDKRWQKEEMGKILILSDINSILLPK